MNYYLDANTDENESSWTNILREAKPEITWLDFKVLCFSYLREIHAYPEILKFHFVGLEDGKITVFFEDYTGEFKIVKSLPYQYFSDQQMYEFAVKFEKLVIREKVGVSIRGVYKDYPCFTIYKK